MVVCDQPHQARRVGAGALNGHPPHAGAVPLHSLHAGFDITWAAAPLRKALAQPFGLEASGTQLQAAPAAHYEQRKWHRHLARAKDDEDREGEESPLDCSADAQPESRSGDLHETERPR
ncbi:hypothetical protein NDU88_004785 [Pleurodeles waltl]|uniref:Uncharacterized protein n=1 Tax=Pleurodeles waltl TaxID=8319 RepID=A0AAV7TSX0_PLEWA|nr:hypothetical protein NDU88_004785 [Pleurodeles waltl]